MRPRLIALLALIVVAPLAITGWLGARLVRDEQAALEHRITNLMTAQLRSVDEILSQAVAEYGEAIASEISAQDAAPEQLRRLAWSSPYVIQYYVMDHDGKLAFPPVKSPADLTADERQALDRTRGIWDKGAFASVAAGDERASEGGEQATGWYVGYWGDGLQWMHWRRVGDRLLIAEVRRARFLAHLLGRLPETDAAASDDAPQRIRLIDNAGESLYQWGHLELDGSTAPDARFNPRPPLTAWTLEYYGDARAYGTAVAGGLLLNLILGLIMAGAVIGGAAWTIYRQQSRDMREAAQRVSFVNQVSHELRTPLTSIRMYAELLEGELDASNERARRHLGVIVSESQRLSRLIANVLSFGRAQRQALRLHRQSASVDEVVRGVIDRFRPAFDNQGLAVAFDPGIVEDVSFDPDIVEQIVGNLLSNAEKYGKEGGVIEVSSRREGTMVGIEVRDHGPGIPDQERERVFEPFYRVNSALTEGVSGTGIGLAISRELARLHGGDLVLLDSPRGARFLLTLACQPSKEDGA